MSERVELLPLLPAVLRSRDIERGEPLRALIELIEEQARVVQEQVSGFYDDLFVETCGDWVVPYIGDLVARPRSTRPSSAGAQTWRTRSTTAVARAWSRCSSGSPAT